MKENQLVASATMMTSVEIAEVASKRHCDVLRAIRVMESAWEKVNGRKFSSVEYTDAKGEKRPCYQLTKTECLYIATKFNDEARARLILRWEELEKERMTPVLAAEQNAATVEILDRLNTALNDARETIDRQNNILDEKSRIISDMERMASLLDPDHKSFTSSVDFQFVVDCMTRLLRLELVKAERVEAMEDRISKLERSMKEKGGEI